jgi:hypothetical protein
VVEHEIEEPVGGGERYRGVPEQCGGDVKSQDDAVEILRDVGPGSDEDGRGGLERESEEEDEKPVALAFVRSSIYVYPIAIDAASTVMISNTDVMGG